MTSKIIGLVKITLFPLKNKYEEKEEEEDEEKQRDRQTEIGRG